MEKVIKKKNPRKLDYFILYLFPLLSTYGFGYIGFNTMILKMLYFISIPLLFIYVFTTIKKSKDEISKYVKYAVSVYLISLMMAWLFHNQAISLTYRATCGYFALLFYFFLKRANFCRKDIILLTLVYGVIWIILWLIALYMAPTPVFGNSDITINDDRGIFRFFIPGDGFLYLLFFLCVELGFIKKYKIFKFLSVTVFTVIVLQVTRQTIFFSFIVAFYFVFRHAKHILVYAILLYIGINLISINVSDDSPLGKLMQLSESQYLDQKSGDENARVVEYRYFLTEMPNNLVTIVFGNGIPHDDSSYGKQFLWLKDVKDIYLSDVGYPAMFVTIGVLGLLIFFKLWRACVKVRGENDFPIMFLNYMFLCNFVSFVISVSIIPICVALYLLQLDAKSTIEKKMN